MSLSNGRSGAVFTHQDGKVTLFASRGIDQHVLDAIQTVWSRFRESFVAGETFYAADLATDRRLKAGERGGAASLAVVPVFEGDELVALLYVDSLDPHFCTAQDLERMSKFSRILAKAVGDTSGPEPRAGRSEAWETYLERTPVEDMEREKLLLLLNRNEWNISRVSRLLGVTRMTVYNRLDRFKIPREHVPKVGRRPIKA